MRAKWKRGHSRYVHEQQAKSVIKKYTKREAQFLMAVCALIGFLIGVII